MSSHLAARPRRVPQQQRGERRVAALLDATAAEISESGYDAATMSAIAERAGASIGSLYQFFPNKESITQALRSRYARSLDEFWAPLEIEAASLDLKTTVGRLIDLMVEFLEAHPALIALLDAPPATRSPEAIRRIIRKRVAGILLAQRPDLGRDRALELATVTLQIMKALNQLNANERIEKRRRFIEEFKAVLVSYLSDRLGNGRAPRRRAQTT